MELLNENASNKEIIDKINELINCHNEAIKIEISKLRSENKYLQMQSEFSKMIDAAFYDTL